VENTEYYVIYGLVLMKVLLGDQGDIVIFKERGVEDEKL
jgi:hypothetical protein